MIVVQITLRDIIREYALTGLALSEFQICDFLKLKYYFQICHFLS